MRLGLDNGAAALYPADRFLNNNTKVVVRPVHAEDEETLLAYYRSLPDELRLRLRQDNTNRAVLKRFLEEIPLGRMISLAAFSAPADGEPELVGEATLRIMHHGWERHVGEIKKCVLPDWSHLGLGAALIIELVEIGSSQGLDKLVYYALDDQVRLRSMLKEMGFEVEAVLKDHATDLAGGKHDVFIMSNYMAELWRRMEDLILNSEFPLES